MLAIRPGAQFCVFVCLPYPVLPVTPVAVLNLGVERPSLAPEQHHDPQSDKQVRKVDQAVVGQVLAQSMRQRHHGGVDHVATTLAPEPEQRAERLGDEGAEVIERGRRVVAGMTVRGRVAFVVGVVIGPGHDEVLV